MGFVFGIKSNWNPHAETWLQVAVEAAHFVQRHSFIKFLKHMFAFIAFTWNANLWMWLQALPVCLNGWCIWRKYSVFLAFKSCFQFMCVKLPSVSKWGGIALTDSVAVNGPHLLLHRRTVHYANQKLWRRWNQERQKRWQMRRMILCDINMLLNHITGGLEYKHTYAVRSLGWITALYFFPSFHFPPLSARSL